MTRQEAIQEQIDEIMDDFEFEKVHEIMTRLNWEWYKYEDNTKSVPDLWEIKKSARQRLKDAVKHGGSMTGGFKALYRDEVDEETGKPFVLLSLQFGLDTLNDGTYYDPE